MKKLLSFFFASLLGLLTLSAQKQWAVGDIMEMDGMRCLVIEVDESGTRGKIMSPSVLDAETKKKIIDYHSKIVDKLIKKGEIDASVREEEIKKRTMLDLAVFDIIPREKKKKGMAYKVDEWSSTLPEGWRLPNLSDITALCSIVFGGIGSEHKVALTKLNDNVKKVTEDKYWCSNILSCFSEGMIWGPDSDPANVMFTSWVIKGVKCYMELRDKYTGKERTVAVKDFGADDSEMDLDANGK